MKGLINKIDRISGFFGTLAGWLCLAMIGVVFYDVIMRYLFAAGSVAMQELEWHLFASMFLLGAAYAMREDANVRVDVFYATMTARKKAWVNLLGTVVFVFPICLLIIWSSYDFVTYSYRIGEQSPDPGGLSYRFIIKAVLPFSMLLLLLQATATILRNLRLLMEKRGSLPRETKS
jgi:TRAP-type mannitol/chloroaromatic compound transport system permease small subunit